MIIRPDPKLGFRALVVRQPYASEILHGDKLVEYRSYVTHYRGDLLITAAARREPGHPGPYAVTLCVVELVSVTMTREGPEWNLRNPRAVAQLPVKGALGLFRVPEDLRTRLGLLAPPEETEWEREERLRSLEYDRQEEQGLDRWRGLDD